MQMKAWWIGTALLAVVAVLVGTALQLAGARRQLVALAGAARTPVTSAAIAAPPLAVAAQAAATAEPARVTRENDTASAERDVAALPGSGFDPERAIHSAAERDPAIAELLNHPDPAIGAALREFVYSVEPPGSR